MSRTDDGASDSSHLRAMRARLVRPIAGPAQVAHPDQQVEKLLDGPGVETAALGDCSRGEWPAGKGVEQPDLGRDHQCPPEGDAVRLEHRVGTRPVASPIRSIGLSAITPNRMGLSSVAQVGDGIRASMAAPDSPVEETVHFPSGIVCR